MGFQELVSHTPRCRRPDEIEGVHYHFVTEEELSQIPMIQSVCYSHYRYGVGILEDKEKLEIGQSIFAILEQQGAQALSKAFPDHVKIYFIQVDPD